MQRSPQLKEIEAFSTTDGTSGADIRVNWAGKRGRDSLLTTSEGLGTRTAAPRGTAASTVRIDSERRPSGSAYKCGTTDQMVQSSMTRRGTLLKSRKLRVNNVNP